jgi:predicted regulator of Ras-like GTPase activity (Roadblock/LC7/MglB family)
MPGSDRTSMPFPPVLLVRPFWEGAPAMPLPADSAGSTHALPAPIGHGARLDALLNELMRRVPELEAAAVVTADGLPMSSALPPGMDEDRVAAMSAALLSLGERAAEGLGRGELSQVHIQGEFGGVWLLAAGDDAVLVGVSAADAKAGLVLFELRRATAAVSTALAADELAEFAERAANAAMRSAPTQAPASTPTQTSAYSAQPAPVPAAPVNAMPAARPAGNQAAPAAPTQTPAPSPLPAAAGYSAPATHPAASNPAPSTSSVPTAWPATGSVGWA